MGPAGSGGEPQHLERALGPQDVPNVIYWLSDPPGLFQRHSHTPTLSVMTRPLEKVPRPWVTRGMESRQGGWLGTDRSCVGAGLTLMGRGSSGSL